MAADHTCYIFSFFYCDLKVMEVQGPFSHGAGEQPVLVGIGRPLEQPRGLSAGESVASDAGPADGRPALSLPVNPLLGENDISHLVEPLSAGRRKDSSDPPMY